MDLEKKRLLIVKPSSLGDVVHTLPVAHAIKRCFPACFIGWIVQKAFVPILETDPAVDEIIPIRIPSTSDPLAPRGIFIQALKSTLATLANLRARFKERPYDVVLDLHASFRSGLLALTNPNGTRIGFADAKELNPLFQHHRLQPDPGKPHAVDKNLAFARFLGCPPADDDFRIVSGPGQRERVEAFLRSNGVWPEDRVVYANPAARWSTKYWTVDGWAGLAELFSTMDRTHMVFAGSPQDAAYISEITRRTSARPIVAAGNLDLGEAVALLQRSDVYVGVDSGPMHIAAFAGLPVVALFGPTDPDKVGPYGPGHLVLTRTDLDCLACRKRSCSDRMCLEGITARHVFDETKRLLGW
jgi:ADP-heptose:LPS heptosyltransferase